MDIKGDFRTLSYFYNTYQRELRYNSNSRYVRIYKSQFIKIFHITAFAYAVRIFEKFSKFLAKIYKHL